MCNEQSTIKEDQSVPRLRRLCDVFGGPGVLQHRGLLVHESADPPHESAAVVSARDVVKRVVPVDEGVFA